MIYDGQKIANVFTINELINIFKIKYEPDFEFSSSSYNCWVLQYMIKGQADVVYNDKKQKLSTGQIIIYKPNTAHYLKVSSNEPADIFIVSFKAKGKAMDLFANGVHKLSPEQRNYVKNMIILLSDESIHEEKNIKGIMEANPIQQNQLGLNIAQANMMQLFLSLYEQSVKEQSDGSHKSVLLDKAVKYMEKNIYSQVSIEDIANYCNVSQTSIKRLFANHAGVSVYKYFLSMKMNAAAQCLKDGEAITKVAEKFGYANQAYFSAVFKRETGIQPSQYKENFK